MQDKFNLEGRYIAISTDTLPSKNRLNNYPPNIFIRGLYLDEVYTLSTSTDVNYYTLCQSMKDVIKGEDNFDITNLELIDFHYLLIASSMATNNNDLEWQVDYDCQCGNNNSEKITINQIEYSEKSEAKVVLNDFTLKPITIKDVKDVAIEKMVSDEVHTNLLNICKMLDGDIKENYIKLIRNYKSIDTIVSLYKNKLLIDLKPITVTCKCGEKKTLSLSFDNLKGFL